MAKKLRSRGEIERGIVKGFDDIHVKGKKPDIHVKGKKPDAVRREIALGIDDLRISDPKCLLPADQGRGICGARAVEGHSISRSVLKKVERSQNEGWVLPTDTIAHKMLYQIMGGGEPSIERKPKTQALTGYFSCKRHDRCVFKKVDNIKPGFDFHDPERQFLFAYRAVLLASAEINGVVRAFRTVEGVVDGKGKLGNEMRRVLGARRQIVSGKMRELKSLQREVGNLRSRLGKERRNQNYSGLHTYSFDLDLSNVEYPMNFAASVLDYDAALKTPLMATVIPLGDFTHKVIASSPKDGVAEDWAEAVKSLELDSLPLLRDGIFGSGYTCIVQTCIVKEDYEKVPKCERSAAARANWQSVEDDINNFRRMPM